MVKKDKSIDTSIQKSVKWFSSSKGASIQTQNITYIDT